MILILRHNHVPIQFQRLIIIVIVIYILLMIQQQQHRIQRQWRQQLQRLDLSLSLSQRQRRSSSSSSSSSTIYMNTPFVVTAWTLIPSNPILRLPQQHHVATATAFCTRRRRRRRRRSCGNVIRERCGNRSSRRQQSRYWIQQQLYTTTRLLLQTQFGRYDDTDSVPSYPPSSRSSSSPFTLSKGIVQFASTSSTTTTTTTAIYGDDHNTRTADDQSTTLSTTVPTEKYTNVTNITSSSSSSLLLQQDQYEQHYRCFVNQAVPEGWCVGIQLHPEFQQQIHSIDEEQPDTVLAVAGSPAISQKKTTDPRPLVAPGSVTPLAPLHWLYQYLHIDEIQFGVQKHRHHIQNRQSFYIGRLAIRHALNVVQQEQEEKVTSQLFTTVVTNCENQTMPTTTTNTANMDMDMDTTRQYNPMIDWTQPSATKTDNLISTTGTSATTSPSTSNRHRIRNSILKDQYGRPQLPYGYFGSISHKGDMGIALVHCQDHPTSPTAPNITSTTDSISTPPPPLGIGVDIEDLSNASVRRNIARKVLTPNEIQKLGTLTSEYYYNSKSLNESIMHQDMNSNTFSTTNTSTFLSIEEEILLRFSCKESVYKAIHPLLCRYVSFQEAEVQPYANGTAEVTLKLNPSATLSTTTTAVMPTQFVTPITLHWFRYENYVITTARIHFQ
jgi:4'-phosphopantetheinyl transferase EntD